MEKVKNVAVLIDAENVPAHSARQIFDEASNYGNVMVKRIFADWSKASVKGWKEEVNRYSMTAVQQFEVQPRKNTIDIALIIQALIVLFEKDVDVFCIAAGDSDYTRLVRELRERIDRYRSFAAGMLNDSVKRLNIENALSTTPRQLRAVGKNKSWEEGLFENMPVVASVTLLSKIQNDLLYAEGEVLGTLLNNIDASDLRVNQVDAFVIPESRIVMRGGSYSANIVLAAVDTTQRPTVYINGTRLGNDRGLYEVTTSRSGDFDYSGYIEIAHGDGTTSKHNFTSSYTVIDPTATISATMMNVLYAGIDNPLSIAVPGIPSNAISASMTNGTLSRNGDTWNAHPDKVGTEAVVTVTATIDGRQQTVATSNFRVRKLPDPMPYIAYTDSKGNPERYRGGKPFAKSLLLQTDGISAAIDDDMLNVAYRVLSFETVFFDSMGNAIPEVSDGDKFSNRQKSSFRRLTRGKRFYISRVRAIGPDGIERTLAPMEVIVN